MLNFKNILEIFLHIATFLARNEFWFQYGKSICSSQAPLTFPYTDYLLDELAHGIKNKNP